MNDNQFLIWTSDIDINEYKEYITDEIMPNKAENDPAIRDMDFDTFVEKYAYDVKMLLDDKNTEELYDEISNLDIPLESDIICIADLGTWRGRIDGYKYEGNNINNIFHSNVKTADSDITFFVEKDGRTLDLKAVEHHHDGVNHYLYRQIKPTLSDSQREKFEMMIYNGECKYPDIVKYTKPLGQEVQKVYGFTLKSEKPKNKQQDIER